jgi:hypothetical protein
METFNQRFEEQLRRYESHCERKYAARLRPKLAQFNGDYIAFTTDLVLRHKQHFSEGVQQLIKHGHVEHSFEWLVVECADLFPEEVVQAAKAMLVRALAEPAAPAAQRTVTTIRIERSLLRDLKQAALARELKFNDLVLDYLRAGLAQDGARPAPQP